MDIDTQLVADNLAYIKQHALAVDALYLDGCIKEQLLVHVPFGIYDAVAIAGFQLGCNLAGTLVYLYAVLVVDESHDVISRDGMATGREDKLVDVFFCDDQWFLLIEILAHNEEFFLFLCADFRLLLLTLTAEEWDIVAPAAGLFYLLVLTLQFVEILFS